MVDWNASPHLKITQQQLREKSQIEGLSTIGPGKISFDPRPFTGKYASEKQSWNVMGADIAEGHAPFEGLRGPRDRLLQACTRRVWNSR
jgi:hypothetical protein